MKVYVARHAETNYNVLKLMNDDPKVDVHLTANGIKQAKALADALKPIDFDLVITSELHRVIETAKILNKHHNVPMTVDSRLNDVKSGFEGKPFRDFINARHAATNQWTVRLSGGESFEDEKDRTKAFLNDLHKRSERCVLIVTSMAIARLIYADINNLPNEEVGEIEISNSQCFNFEI